MLNARGVITVCGGEVCLALDLTKQLQELGAAFFFGACFLDDVLWQQDNPQCDIAACIFMHVEAFGAQVARTWEGNDAPTSASSARSAPSMFVAKLRRRTVPILTFYKAQNSRRAVNCKMFMAR